MTQLPQETAPLDPQDKLMLDWQNKIHHELKAVNGKLNYFIILSILVVLGNIVGGFLGSLMR